MKMYRGLEVYLHIFLTLALDSDDKAYDRLGKGKVVPVLNQVLHLENRSST